jgi:hypothetical protein
LVKIAYVYISVAGLRRTCGLVAMTSASHAEGRQFDPGQVYVLGVKSGLMPQIDFLRLANRIAEANRFAQIRRSLLQINKQIAGKWIWQIVFAGFHMGVTPWQIGKPANRQIDVPTRLIQGHLPEP